MCDALKNILPNIDETEVRQRLEKIGADVSESIDRTRMLARGLAPVALESNGLISALEELTSSIATLSIVKCSFLAKGKIVVRDSIAATHLFRITQEAINNALKHAKAKQIVVSLETKGDKNVLTIADDGIGFSQSEAHHPTERWVCVTLLIAPG